MSGSSSSKGRGWQKLSEPLELEAGTVGTGRRANGSALDGNSRTSSISKRTVLWLCLLLIICILSFLVGRVTTSTETSTIECNTSKNGDWGDTVAPEGRVSSTFQAMYDYRGRSRVLSTANGAVAADHGRCSDIGSKVLQQGGNAVDAAIATALCQGIVNPMASGIGGGTIIMIRTANGDAEVIDAREEAPLAATERMFVGNATASIAGGLAAAVPLELKGLYVAHQRHGVLPWSDLLAPAIDLAAHGFPAHPYLVAVLGNKETLAAFENFHELSKTFLIEDRGQLRPPRLNETCCKRPALAQLLRDVAQHGPDVLYTGSYAAGFVADIQAAGGIITLEDLQRIQPQIKAPIKAHTMGVDLLLPPPPSSAATVYTALNVLAGYDLPLAGSGSLGVHRLVESMKHAFAIRMSLGDPGTTGTFMNLTDILQDALSNKYARQLRMMINDTGVLDPTMYGGRWNVLNGGLHKDDHGTSHLCVVDKQRMAVSLTTTINTGFGSKVISPSTGILLNNQMDDFSTPDQANIYGIPPSASNFIQPGKKPFSSMSPIIIEQDGELRLVVGASGGPRIISSVLETLLRLVSYGEDLFAAVAGPRLHHQLVPASLFYEQWSAGGVEFSFSNDTASELAMRGHSVAATAWGAVVQAIEVDEGLDSYLHAVSDPRKDGAPSAE